jgi:NTP pyrophosphatase (non-canonical NTP hydrolase)
MGELGEAANIVKKLNRIRDGIPGNTISENELKENLAKEIADVFIYLDLMAQSQGLNLEKIVIEKFNETSRKIGSTILIPESQS